LTSYRPPLISMVYLHSDFIFVLVMESPYFM
jgi:hypothetical protein